MPTDSPPWAALPEPTRAPQVAAEVTAEVAGEAPWDRPEMETWPPTDDHASAEAWSPATAMDTDAKAPSSDAGDDSAFLTFGRATEMTAASDVVSTPMWDATPAPWDTADDPVWFDPTANATAGAADTPTNAADADAHAAASADPAPWDTFDSTDDAAQSDVEAQPAVATSDEMATDMTVSGRAPWDTPVPYALDELGMVDDRPADMLEPYDEMVPWVTRAVAAASAQAQTQTQTTDPDDAFAPVLQDVEEPSRPHWPEWNAPSEQVASRMPVAPSTFGDKAVGPTPPDELFAAPEAEAEAAPEMQALAETGPETEAAPEMEAVAETEPEAEADAAAEMEAVAQTEPETEAAPEMEAVAETEPEADLASQPVAWDAHWFDSITGDDAVDDDATAEVMATSDDTAEPEDESAVEFAAQQDLDDEPLTFGSSDDEAEADSGREPELETSAPQIMQADVELPATYSTGSAGPGQPLVLRIELAIVDGKPHVRSADGARLVGQSSDDDDDSKTPRHPEFEPRTPLGQADGDDTADDDHDDPSTTDDRWALPPVQAARPASHWADANPTADWSLEPAAADPLSKLPAASFDSKPAQSAPAVRSAWFNAPGATPQSAPVFESVAPAASVQNAAVKPAVAQSRHAVAANQSDLWFLASEPVAEAAGDAAVEKAPETSTFMTAGLTVVMAVIVIGLILVFLALMTSIKL
jgi:hypothetical protein